MTRIDFYILPDQAPEQRLRFTCRLVEKAYTLGHRVYIHTDNERTAAHLDELLWTYRADGFIPHQRSEEATEAPAPIEIGQDQDPAQHDDLLVNLAANTPRFFSRFQRVAEVIIQDPAVLDDSRKRFSFYRTRGYPMQTHDLRHKT